MILCCTSPLNREFVGLIRCVTSCTTTIFSLGLFSQDGDELHVAKATVPNGYIEQMKEKRDDPIQEKEFVQIEQYVLYKTKKSEHVAYFASLVLAFADSRASGNDAA